MDNKKPITHIDSNNQDKKINGCNVNTKMNFTVGTIAIIIASGLAYFAYNYFKK